MSSPGFSPSDAADVELRPAGFNERFIAYVIDVLPFAALYIGGAWALAWGLLPAAVLTQARLAVACGALCFLYQWAANAAGGGIGKRLMGLRVVSRDGAVPGAAAALMRAVGWTLSAPLFNWGFLIALGHPESRALDDLISGTVVVEEQERPTAESWLLFVCAGVVLLGLYGAAALGSLAQPTRSDLAAIDKARRGLLVVAAIEESLRARRGAYSDSLSELAAASGDSAGFRPAMLELFQPEGFRLLATARGYSVSGLAKDRRRTRVTVEGPPARVSSR